MAKRKGQLKSQTLGTWLKNLRHGDPCPWCGAALGSANGGTRTDGVSERLAGGGVSRPALVCSECGCEIDAVDVSDTSLSRRYYRAA